MSVRTYACIPGMFQPAAKDNPKCVPWDLMCARLRPCLRTVDGRWNQTLAVLLSTPAPPNFIKFQCCLWAPRLAPVDKKLKDQITPQINFFQWSQADVKMRWERQEGKEMVQDRLGERAVCDSVVWVCKFVYVKVLCVKSERVVCDKVVCKKLCVKEMYVTKLCVKELCVKEFYVTKLCVKELCVPPEPVQCQKCHNCHAKWRSMSPSATPATQRAAASTASTGNQARHQSQPSAISATPAAQNARPCRQVPRLPRGDKLCVSKFCGDKLYVSKLCVWASCAWASCAWTSCVLTSCVLCVGRRERAGRGQDAGRTRAGRGQDVGRRKKQEPLTKMWGIKPWTQRKLDRVLFNIEIWGVGFYLVDVCRVFCPSTVGPCWTRRNCFVLFCGVNHCWVKSWVTFWVPELTFRKGRCLGMHSSSGWSYGFNYQMIGEGTKQMLWKLPHVPKYHFWQIEHDRTKCSWLYPCMWGLHAAKWGPGWRFSDRKWSFESSVGFISTLGSNFRRVPRSKLTIDMDNPWTSTICRSFPRETVISMAMLVPENLVGPIFRWISPGRHEFFNCQVRKNQWWSFQLCGSIQ